jgi:hypothetical protein
MLSADVDKVATPLPLSAELPIVVAPSRNVTVPVGVPVVVELTVAVRVTDCPSPDGLAEEISKVVLPAICTVCVSTTVCGWNLLSPE